MMQLAAVAWLPLELLQGLFTEAAGHVYPLFYVLFPYWTIMIVAIALSPFTLLIPQWLRGELSCPRRQDIKDEWVIHGKKYNLQPFLKHHPGGSWVLRSAKGSDCTGLFESYHIFVDREVLLRMLARYEIKEAEESKDPKEDLTPPMVFADPFYADLKQVVRDHFKGMPRGSHKMSWSHVALCWLAWSTMWYCIYLMMTDPSQPKWVVPVIASCSWYLTGNVMHDASHGAFVQKPWVNRAMTHAAFPFGVNPSGWFIQHVMSHHIYTNEEGDVDLFHFDPVMTLHKKGVVANSINMGLHLLRLFHLTSTAILHLLFVVPYGVLVGHTDPAHGHKMYDRVKALQAHRVEMRFAMSAEILVTIAYWLLAYWNMGALRGLCYHFSIYSVSGWLFSFFTQVSHLQESCFPDEKALSKLSFAKRQVASSIDYAADSFFWGHMSGGLNTQAIHHCFPSVSAMHLRALYPAFRKVCKKHDVQIKESSSLASFVWGFVEFSN